MKNLQLSVDIDDQRATMDAQTNEHKVKDMSLDIRQKREIIEAYAKASGIDVKDIKIVSCDGVFDGNLSIKFSVKKFSPRKKALDSAIKACKDYVELIGLDIKAYERYVFGKSIAFYLSYGGSDVHKALDIGRKAVNNINYSFLVGRPDLLKKCVQEPDRLKRYESMLAHVAFNDLKSAREEAINIWKKNLAKGIVEDSTILKDLIQKGECRRSAMEVGDVVALKFISDNLADLNLI